MARRTARPVGRPPGLDDLLGGDADGAPVTVFDRIVSFMRVGAYIEEAAGAAGVHREAVRQWLRDGARIARDCHNGRRRWNTVTKKEMRLVEFVGAVDQAVQTWAVQAEAQLERLGRGGEPLEVVTEKVDGQGNVIETSTRRTRREPNAAVLMWRLERRFPERWGRRRVELTGADGGPIEVASPREAIMARLGIIEARLHGEDVPQLSAVSADADDPGFADLDDFDS